MKNNQLDKESKDVINNNNLYFSLIPHLFGHKIQESDWILDNTKLAAEFELLDNLETAVQMGSSLQQNAQQKVNALGTDIEVLKDKKDFDRIVKYIEGSKASNHHGTNVWKYKVKNIFKMKIPFERTRFESKGKQKGNLKELFHGSKNCNILSILKNGLIIPPTSCATYSGRAFGDGIYFANNSTKSLNYSIGFWGGSIRNKFNNAFLFLANVAMGKTYEATYGVSNGAPKGYDSIYAKKGSGLYNDEFIVYDLAQASLTYLVEMN